MNVQTLALADECSTIRSEVNDLLLTNFPNGLVDGLDVIGDGRNVLDRTYCELHVSMSWITTLDSS